MALHLLLTVFSHAQHDTSDCVGLQISFQAEHHSLSEFSKAQFFVFCFFTFSTVHIKQVQVVCHIVINEKKNIVANELLSNTGWKLWHLLVVLCANILQCVCFQRTIKDKISPCLLKTNVSNIHLTTCVLCLHVFVESMFIVQISKIHFFFCFAAHLQVNKATVMFTSAECNYWLATSEVLSMSLQNWVA